MTDEARTGMKSPHSQDSFKLPGILKLRELALYLKPVGRKSKRTYF